MSGILEMDKRGPSPSFISDSPASKIRRTARACLQCRSRKQRCLPSSGVPNHQAPCKRCRQLVITCSFETTPAPPNNASSSPSQMAQLIVHLQQRLNSHEERIAQLESGSGAPPAVERYTDEADLVHSSSQSDGLANGANRPTDYPSIKGQPLPTPAFSMDRLDLGPPIATLRTLGQLSEHETSHNAGTPVSRTVAASNIVTSCDPVSRGILSTQDAEKAMNIYFDHCHPHAPVLSEKLRCSMQYLRDTSPSLFLAICSVGARFWTESSSQGLERGLHPNFFELTALLDSAISRLLLRPTPSDVTLDSIRLLLLYAQWMPCTKDDEPYEGSRTPATRHSPRSRYNDISAWAVIGLAARYAVLINLERCAIAPFQDPADAVTDDDVSRMRVLVNLLTCDYNLMLSSGLPASIDPGPVVSVGRVFGTHHASQQPSDHRVTALVELVVIAHRATLSANDSSGRQLDAVCLRTANTEFDEWERYWTPRLRATESQHNQLPFNSVRWYRLALNSASLGPLLSHNGESQPQVLEISRLHSLEISLTAAAQMLFSLSVFGAERVWGLQSQSPSSFPEGRFAADSGALARLCYAVDSTWISHTFAVTFLVLCYIRKIVDDELRICGLTPASLQKTCAPSPPRADSIISRLIHLALEIFDGVCEGPAFHPARDFRAIVHNAASLILAPGGDDMLHEQEEVDHVAMQSLLDLMNDSGLEWPESLFGHGADFTSGWGDVTPGP